MFRFFLFSFERDGVFFVKKFVVSDNVWNGFCSFGGNIRLVLMNWLIGLCLYLV